MAPRFFINNENGNLREFFYNGGPRSRDSGLSINTVNLKKITKHDFFKIK